MYCLVDFRNRPQQKYTFSKLEQARECLRRIQNNPLGVTVFFADGRREYFENGLPQGFFASSDKTIQIKKGCHAKYHIRSLSNLDGVLKKNAETRDSSAANWQKKSIFSLFMLGNRKVYASLAIVSFMVFASTVYFQNQSSHNAAQTEGQIAGASDERIAPNDSDADDSLKLADDEIVMNLLGKIEDARAGEFETEILKYIKNKPMEAMAPYIAKQDRIVAAFIVGISMKESKFGIYAPHDANGRDCLNYWGYRGRENTTASGYSCFNSPEQAIQVIGKKIDSLVARGISNPAEMISWKCGSTCAGHGAESVRKWIADVGVNFYKINSKDNT